MYWQNYFINGQTLPEKLRCSIQVTQELVDKSEMEQRY